METPYYWTIFGILVFLLCVLCIYLVLNIARDYCIPKDRKHQKRKSIPRTEMVKYSFNKSDVEDLTKIEGDLRTVVPRLSFRNEVDTTKVQLLLRSESNDNKSITETDNKSEDNVTESDMIENDKCNSDDVSEDNVIELDTTKPDKENNEEVIGVTQNDISIENLDPMSIEVLKTINVIEIRARKLLEEMKSFTGRLSELKYYDVNETFIRLQIDLSDIFCDRKELRLRKMEVLDYIRMCQQELRNSSMQNF